MKHSLFALCEIPEVTFRYHPAIVWKETVEEVISVLGPLK